MRRMIGGIWSGAVTLLFLCGNALAQAEDPALLVKMELEMLRPTVFIDAERGQGSGTVIYDHPEGVKARCIDFGRFGFTSVGKQCITGVLVLTNLHIFSEHVFVIPKDYDPDKDEKEDERVWPLQKKPKPVTVNFFSYEGPYVDQITTHTFEATVISWNKKNDLGILHIANVPKRLIAVAQLATKETKPRRGDRAWRVECPQGFEPLYTDGRFGSVDKDRPQGEPRLIATPPLSEGGSGGGVYHFFRGRFEMVAVTAQSAPDNDNTQVEHVSINIMIQDVHTFLSESGLGFVVE